MTRKVINHETGRETVLRSDEDFLEFTRSLYRENESGSEEVFGPSTIHFLPQNTQQATEYIVEYCPGTELIEE